MKTKTFYVLCLLSAVGIMQLSAQNGKGGTGTVPFVETQLNNPANLEIICEGDVVDVLVFPLSFDLRIRDHYNKGEITWSKYLLNNAPLTSLRTNEVFNTQDMESIRERGVFIWSSHLNGNMGSHYNIRMIWDAVTWEIIDYKTTCYINAFVPEEP